MDGRMDGWMDEWMEVLSGGIINRWVKKLMFG